jgi:hypothetical protein
LENTALFHVHVGTVFQLDGTTPHFFRHVHAFLDREYRDHWLGREGPISWLLIPQIWLLWAFSLAVCEWSDLQSALLMKYLVRSKKLIVMMCVVPLMVLILRSTEHVRNFVSFSIWKCIDFSNTCYSWRNIMFYFIAI